MGQEYRDLQKLIPAVQYTQDQTRGPSAGGSGQDNVYQFDGVNVTLPLFGTMSSEPASHDIAQVNVVARRRARRRLRPLGRLLDGLRQQVRHLPASTARRSYQFHSSGMSADLNADIRSRYEHDRELDQRQPGRPAR